MGRPVVITGRFKGDVSDVKVNGRVNMEAASYTINLTDADAKQKHAGVAAVWARLKIKDMMNGLTQSPGMLSDIQPMVLETALNHNLMSQYTCLLYTSPSPRDQRGSRMPSSA